MPGRMMQCWHTCEYACRPVLTAAELVCARADDHRTSRLHARSGHSAAVRSLSSQTRRRLSRDARAAAQTTHQTAHGQLLDIATAPIGTVDLSRYTLPTYMRIVTFKTAFYSFYLPVACGLLVGGVAAPPALALARDICVQMGQYFQARAAPRTWSRLR